ncbi:DUF4468 domain-containing protein [Hymenobacter aerilatus]|uniref:DUF4468 domain-containing protein n=1 Tax=Hymenobacter aerilatus TaxID=2932251 RepID=A0A8T9SSE2_9BACT|nr:DUF4468 domain-containing protein [Hymenobacter aerilatus]UOR05042.1 DUF4468 domain-containing protein [Hymenobacter aerilatus]
MKNSLLGFLLSSLLLLSLSSLAQSTSPIAYGEQVQASGAGRRALYQHALAWSEKGFTYAPKTDVKADAAAGTLQLRGTSKVKTLNNNKPVETAVRFEFVFRATDNGYDYNIGSFEVVPNNKQPTVTVQLDDYIAQLAADRDNSRTNNDRRVRAQASSLASEVALSFRSYMNSHEGESDDTIGLK